MNKKDNIIFHRVNTYGSSVAPRTKIKMQMKIGGLEK
jgi:hypothetical protein